MFRHRNALDRRVIDTALDSFGRQSSDQRVLRNTTQRNVDHYGGTTPAQNDRHQYGYTHTEVGLAVSIGVASGHRSYAGMWPAYAD